MANGKVSIEYKQLFLDHVKDLAGLYLGFVGTVMDYTENFGELDVETDIVMLDVAAKFNGSASNPSTTLCRVANDSAIVTGVATAGGVSLTGWFLATTNVPTTAVIVAQQNFATPVTTVQGLPLT